ncbi:MAG: adenosylcobinamide-GDP ribazoletransferase [Rikenellaceae bacterium]|nr:adenosylcobinamide-GDP ribazoletransferase [Rikenellaceae bacterium]
MLKRELDIFFATLMFYTRIPVPYRTGHSDEILNKTTRYFTLVGIIVGAIGGLTFWSLNLILPENLAVILSMIATIFATGAFHEDGFADTCDGFGGGYTKEKVLEIMKDSRIGTYGTVGLLLILMTKFCCLSSSPVYLIPAILISGHSFSRFWPVCMLYLQSYVRPADQSKSKPVGKRASSTSLIIAAFFGFIPLLLLPYQSILFSASLCMIVFVSFSSYTKRRIGGYTGDVLGATQQLCEVAFYLGFLIYIHFAH